MASPIIMTTLGDFYEGDLNYFIEQYNYIESVLARSPKYTALDSASAAELANLCLAASVTCSELIHDISRQSGLLETRVKAAEAKALDDCQETRAVLKRTASQSSEALVAAQNKATAARSLLDLLKRQYQILIAQHYNCRSVAQETHSIHSGDRASDADLENFL